MKKKSLMTIAVVSGAFAMGVVGAMMDGLTGAVIGAIAGGVIAGAITTSFTHSHKDCEED